MEDTTAPEDYDVAGPCGFLFAVRWVHASHPVHVSVHGQRS